jgi:hypothetical protein
MLTKRTRLFRFGPALLALMMVMALGTALLVSAQDDQPPAGQNTGAPLGPNLLANPYFDVGGFYFRSPNSLVASGWFRWDVTRPDGPNPIPEFIDGGSPYHNSCYPEPPAGGLCADMTPKNHSQGYIKMGNTYIAGVWQPVQVMACVNYQFAGYVRTDTPGYHPKVGIDPTGWQMPPRDNPNPDLDYVCPPTGHSLCPRDHFSYESDMPTSIVWSAPYAYDPPPPIAPVWRGPLSITTEALSTTVTVWTYAAPDKGPSQSTYWDYMSLYQVPPPSGRIIGDGTFPASDGTIQNVVTSTTAMRANLSWQTTGPAVTQVLYHYVGDAASTVLPPVANVASSYEFSTTIAYGANMAHSARLPNLRPQSAYDYAILSRKLVGSTCQTSVLTGRLLTTDALVEAGPLPAPSSDIIGITILPLETSAYVIWQSAQPAYGQVLYHLNGPALVTIPPTMTSRVYLPLVSAAPVSGSTLDYEFRTPVDTPSTLHIVRLTNLQRDSSYSAVAVSAWSSGDQDMAAASARQVFRTATTPNLAATTSPDQLIEKLQACVLGGRTLTSCTEELAR